MYKGLLWCIKEYTVFQFQIDPNKDPIQIHCFAILGLIEDLQAQVEIFSPPAVLLLILLLNFLHLVYFMHPILPGP